MKSSTKRLVREIQFNVNNEPRLIQLFEQVERLPKQEIIEMLQYFTGALDYCRGKAGYNRAPKKQNKTKLRSYLDNPFGAW